VVDFLIAGHIYCVSALSLHIESTDSMISNAFYFSYTVVWPAPSELDNIEGTVDVDKWWRHVDSIIVEAALFRSSTSEQVQVTDIAPWIPPSCKNSTVVNTEHLKVSSYAIESLNGKPFGCPKKLADLVRRGRYDSLELHGMSTQEVKQIAEVEIPSSVGSAKVLYKYND